MNDTSIWLFFAVWAPIRFVQYFVVRPRRLLEQGRKTLAYSLTVGERILFLAVIVWAVPDDPAKTLRLDTAGPGGWVGALVLGLVGAAVSMAAAGGLPRLVLAVAGKTSPLRALWAGGERKAEMLRGLAPTSAAEWIATLLLVCLFAAAFAEEIIFRGFLQASGESVLPVAVAAVLQTAFFGAEHARGQGLRGAIEAGLSGAVLTALVLGTGSLWPAIVAHFVQDAVGVTALYQAHRSGRLDAVIRDSAHSS